MDISEILTLITISGGVTIILFIFIFAHYASSEISLNSALSNYTKNGIGCDGRESRICTYDDGNVSLCMKYTVDGYERSGIMDPRIKMTRAELFSILNQQYVYILVDPNNITKFIPGRKISDRKPNTVFSVAGHITVGSIGAIIILLSIFTIMKSAMAIHLFDCFISLFESNIN